MDKETWKRHIEESAGITRPSHGGNLETWQAVLLDHRHCPICAERRKTMRKNKSARTTRAMYRDLGMNRVIGSESGSVYYE